MSTIRNVLGEPLVLCGEDPATGFFRDGHCQTAKHDYGAHVICAQVTEEFLSYSKSQGNDLVTPMPEFGFPGLRPGDRWCLCASRWKQAADAGVAPRVILTATHEAALEVVSLDTLKAHALDLC